MNLRQQIQAVALEFYGDINLSEKFYTWLLGLDDAHRTTSGVDMNLAKNLAGGTCSNYASQINNALKRYKNLNPHRPITKNLLVELEESGEWEEVVGDMPRSAYLRFERFLKEEL